MAVSRFKDEVIIFSASMPPTFRRPIDSDKIETHYEHGILTINVPLSEVSRPKKISVKGSQSQPTTVEAQKEP